MVLSMTGYGRAQQVLGGREITVELRSVNARYFEYSSRLPRTCAFLEDPLKRLTAEKVHRGKVELALTIQNVTATDAVVQADYALAESYRRALAALAQRLDVKDDVTVMALARFPDVLTPDGRPGRPGRPVGRCFGRGGPGAGSVRRYARGGRRKAQGRCRKPPCGGRRPCRADRTGQRRARAGIHRTPVRRLQELLADRSIDEARILTEAALFADKTAIDEETVRLHSHVAQFREILQLEEPIGRKLDFLTQELNREANTIGSKCQDAALTRLVVTLKSEIEKIREQIQNIE